MRRRKLDRALTKMYGKMGSNGRRRFHLSIRRIRSGAMTAQSEIPTSLGTESMPIEPIPRGTQYFWEERARRIRPGSTSWSYW